MGNRIKLIPTGADAPMPFGCFHGKPMRDVPDWYLAILLDGTDNPDHPEIRAEWDRRRAVATKPLTPCARCGLITDDPVQRGPHSYHRTCAAKL